MKLSRLIGAAGAAAAAVALLAGPAHAEAHAAAGAVFVQTDDPAGNTVVAYDRNPDGSLRQAGSYRTGGRGGVLDGSVVDHLASQGSLAFDRAGGLLYAVNAGSDTITVFRVHGDRLTRRRVLPSFGDFPVSIAVHGSSLYVLNARGGGSLQGFLRAGGALVPVPGRHRGLGLDPAATPEFTHTPGEVAFTPDGDQLVVTTKANGNAVDVFGVGRTRWARGPPGHDRAARTRSRSPSRSTRAGTSRSPRQARTRSRRSRSTRRAGSIRSRTPRRARRRRAGS